MAMTRKEANAVMRHKYGGDWYENEGALEERDRLRFVKAAKKAAPKRRRVRAPKLSHPLSASGRARRKKRGLEPDNAIPRGWTYLPMDEDGNYDFSGMDDENIFLAMEQHGVTAYKVVGTVGSWEDSDGDHSLPAGFAPGLSVVIATATHTNRGIRYGVSLYDEEDVAQKKLSSPSDTAKNALLVAKQHYKNFSLPRH